MSNTISATHIVGSSSAHVAIALQPGMQPKASLGATDDLVAPVLSKPGMLCLCCPTIIAGAASRMAAYCFASFEARLDSGTPLWIDAYNSHWYLPIPLKQSSADPSWANRNALESRI